MKRNVSLPVVLLVLVAVAAVIFVVYKNYAYVKPVAHPGAADIPPRQPGDDKPAPPPPDAGRMPGTAPR